MLDITGSEIQELESIKQLQNLTTLQICNAKLSGASAIEQKTNIAVLCLADCELAELNLCGFTGLEHLDLLGTKTKLTGSFQKL